MQRTWAIAMEVRSDPAPPFIWTCQAGDDRVVLIKDVGRNFTIEFPLEGGESRLSSDDGKSWRELYEVRKEISQ